MGDRGGRHPGAGGRRPTRHPWLRKWEATATTGTARANATIGSSSDPDGGDPRHGGGRGRPFRRLRAPSPEVGRSGPGDGDPRTDESAAERRRPALN